MFAGKETLIGTVDDDGVLAEAGFIEVGKDAPHVTVEAVHATHRVRDVALVGVADAILAFELSGGLELLVFAIARIVGLMPHRALRGTHLLEEMRHLLRVRRKFFLSRTDVEPGTTHAAEFHPSVRHEGLPRGVVVEQRRRFRENHAIIRSHVFERGSARCVRSL